MLFETRFQTRKAAQRQIISNLRNALDRNRAVRQRPRAIDSDNTRQQKRQIVVEHLVLETLGQQIALGKQLIPDAKKVAIMYCSSESNSKIQSDLAEAAIKEQGMESVVKTVSAIDEAKSAIESLKGQVDFIYIPTDNTLADGMTSVSAAANECGIPTIVGESGMVGNGAFATYGINYYELGKTTAAMAVKILKGEAEPASMPIEYQTDESVLEVAINTETADKLGITIPDEVKSTATLLP